MTLADQFTVHPSKGGVYVKCSLCGAVGKPEPQEGPTLKQLAHVARYSTKVRVTPDLRRLAMALEVVEDVRFPTHTAAVRCVDCGGTTALTLGADGLFRCRERHEIIAHVRHWDGPYARRVRAR